MLTFSHTEHLISHCDLLAFIGDGYIKASDWRLGILLLNHLEKNK